MIFYSILFYKLIFTAYSVHVGDFLPHSQYTQEIFYRILSARSIIFAAHSVGVEYFLAHTQSAEKTKMPNNSLTTHTNRFFGSFLKSPIQMGWLSIINSVTNISRLGTFKASLTKIVMYKFEFQHLCYICKEKKSLQYSGR